MSEYLHPHVQDLANKIEHGESALSISNALMAVCLEPLRRLANAVAEYHEAYKRPPTNTPVAKHHVRQLRFALRDERALQRILVLTATGLSNLLGLKVRVSAEAAQQIQAGPPRPPRPNDIRKEDLAKVVDVLMQDPQWRFYDNIPEQNTRTSRQGIPSADSATSLLQLQVCRYLDMIDQTLSLYEAFDQACRLRKEQDPRRKEQIRAVRFAVKDRMQVALAMHPAIDALYDRLGLKLHLELESFHLQTESPAERRRKMARYLHGYFIEKCISLNLPSDIFADACDKAGVDLGIRRQTDRKQQKAVNE